MIQDHTAFIEAFQKDFQGDIILKNHNNYDEVRQIWNSMIDRRPALIARCKTAEQVSQAVTIARQHNVLVSVRGGGHNIAGKALCDDGIMIDLSLMKKVTVNTDTRRAMVEPGCTLGDFDAAVQSFGLATPTGVNSTTGIAGLTLGGGFGWLSRKYGMTVDNLISAKVVTADGKTVNASETENEDLFWALRGGGGNFGVVTRFEFQLHPVGPDVLSGLIVYPFNQAKSVLTQFARFTEEMPDELNVWMFTRKAPPLPFLPAEIHGKEMIALALCYTGNPEEGEKRIAPLRKFGTPVGEHVGVQPYSEWQQAFDPLLTPGARNYWKSHNLNELRPEMIESLIKFAGILPSDQCEIFIGTIGGKASRIKEDTTAYSGRDALYALNVHGRWESAEQDTKCIKWARDFFEESKPFASAGVYINFMTEEEGDRVAFSYGKNYSRLQKIKKKYDPSNFFRMNQNIKPN